MKATKTPIENLKAIICGSVLAKPKAIVPTEANSTPVMAVGFLPIPSLRYEAGANPSRTPAE